MKIHTPHKFVLLLLPFLLFSCVSKKKMVYLQGIENANSYEANTNYEPKLKPDDLLSIIIASENPELTVPFNLPAIQGNYEINNNQNGIKTYLIDNAGYIDFPVLGQVKLGGLTRTEAHQKMEDLLSEYIKKPGVNIRILNYKIAVIGEVNKPGNYTIPSERITILEAIGNAGDLTIYGKRDNILVIHEENGKKTYTRIDITKADVLNSPAYYLSQNDVVLVEPNRTKLNSSAVGPNTTVILGGITVLISILVLLKK